MRLLAPRLISMVVVWKCVISWWHEVLVGQSPITKSRGVSIAIAAERHFVRCDEEDVECRAIGTD
jgi:hypothetical protein